jgi:uncharacterized protein
MKNSAIDMHAHLNEEISGPAINAANELNEMLETNGIEKAIVLHLAFQRWSLDEVAETINAHERLIGFVNIHPDMEDALTVLTHAVQKLKFRGLKLHPRLLEHDIDSDNTIELVKHAGKLGLPTIICGFPDGDWLMQGSTVLKYANLAKACPNTRIVVAHMGGHHVLDLMMLAKRIPNMYFDTSYTLLYYRGSAVIQNIVYAMRSMRFERIFYGSDYPDRSVKDTLEGSYNLLKEYDLSEDEITKILYTNAKEFLNWMNV